MFAMLNVLKLVVFVSLATSNGLAIRNVIRADCDCGRRYGQVNDLVIGGHNATNYPWMAILERNSRFACGASLINDRFLLTAAHCVQNAQPRQLVVRLGANMRYDSKGSLHRVRKAIVHQNYASPTLSNDVALLQLEKPIKFTLRMSPVCLPTPTMSKFDSVYVIGFGRNDKNTVGLLKAELIEWKLPACAEQVSKWGVRVPVTKENICAGGVAGRNACYGDSGGPLVFQKLFYHFKVGIVSWGPRGCSNLTVFTRTSSYYNWIHDAVAANDARAIWCRNDYTD